MSAPEATGMTAGTPAPVPCRITQLAAWPGEWPLLAQRCQSRGLRLPAQAPGAIGSAEHLVLQLRPERLLLLTDSAGNPAQEHTWREDCADCAAVNDLSGAFSVLKLPDPPARAVLRLGCHLDLSPAVFPQGSAAITPLAQVTIAVAALPGELLLLVPSTFTQHLQEWCAAAAAGLARDQQTQGNT
ncbi:MAG: hypothetical protein JSR67_03315 [Proteobacteria bacterium]|nr:hypothetical protein [Pseudomonadota bacterium]